ncbi:2-deoxystreptamine glucosyltransferase [Methylocystis sp. MJC1]|jgi:glycosyltransferase involved in cell wall biosynthesis|nr:2-deoxystreptamine glucosyltransferase [Methylocystis sp. MJC1]
MHLVVPKQWREFGRVLDAEGETDPRMNLHILPIVIPDAGPMNWYLHFYPGLRRLLKQTRPDVLHLWEEPWSLVALQAALLKSNAALVLEVDQNILRTLPPPFEWIRRFVLGRTAHVLARSADAQMVVRARGYKGPVSFIGYGVDRDRFHPGPVAEKGAGAPLKIGYVGRVVIEKGLDDALDALARTEAAHTLSILGEGPHRPALQARAEQSGLSSRLSFASWGSPDEVASFLRGVDVLILLTRTMPRVKEQFGRVIIEAQSCGVPVIGSTCGAIPDVVGEGGWIIPESDPASLAQLLDEIGKDPALLKAKREAAIKNAARFSYEAVASVLKAAWVEAAGEAIHRESRARA